MQIVSADVFSELAEDAKEQSCSSLPLQYRGADVPYDEENNTFYLSTALSSDTDDHITRLKRLSAGSGVVISIEDDPVLRDKSAAVSDGYAFNMLIQTDGENRLTHLVFTGLPTIAVEFDGGKLRGKEEHEGVVSVIDGTRDQEGKWFCGFRLRGSTSIYFDKKNYHLELHDRDGNNRKVSLLGMRSDDDWVLNSMCSDKTLCREKVCYQLWEDVNSLSDTPVPSSTIEYTELFIGDAYMGVYGFMEPIDGRMMGLGAEDILYKIQKWRNESVIDGSLTDYNGEQSLIDRGGYAYAKIQHPRDPNTFRWDVLASYEKFVFDDQDLNALQKAGISLHTENYMTHNLFCVMTHAEDNTWKNLLIAARHTGEGNYLLYETIWDINYSFGDVFHYDFDRQNVRFDRYSSSSMQLRKDKDFAYCALEQADPSIADATQQLWEKWRRAGISAKYCISLFASDHAQLVQSGALEREHQRWITGENSGDIQETEQWITERFRFLDYYFRFTE